MRTGCGYEQLLHAFNVPLHRVDQHLAEFPTKKQVVLRSPGGKRGMIAASNQKARGWNNLGDVESDLSGIKKAGVKVTEYVFPTTLL